MDLTGDDTGVGTHRTVITCDRAGLGNDGIHNAEVLQRAACDTAEQARLKVVGKRHVQIPNDMILSVKGALVLHVAIHGIGVETDGDPDPVIKVDIRYPSSMGGIFDRFVGLSATAIDCRRKGVQLVGGADVIMAVAVLLTLRFGTVLLLYSRPMEDMTLDLSRVNHTGHVTPDSGDEKGWDVYTREGDTVTEPEYNSRGSYSGLELIRTIYLSRVLAEELDSPTLQIGAFSKTYVVWLDDEVLYIDFPEGENRMGYLRLPMRKSQQSFENCSGTMLRLRT